MRDSFFLGADFEENKMTWVSWKKVMAQKVHGGLRVSNLFSLNRAFIFNGFDVLFLLPLPYSALLISNLHTSKL